MDVWNENLGMGMGIEMAIGIRIGMGVDSFNVILKGYVWFHGICAMRCAYVKLILALRLYCKTRRSPKSGFYRCVDKLKSVRSLTI